MTTMMDQYRSWFHIGDQAMTLTTPVNYTGDLSRKTGESLMARHNRARFAWQEGERGMNILLWVLQVLLALAFFAHGGLVLFPPPAIAAMMYASFPRSFWLFLGVAEILAAVGVTLPSLTRIQPWLVSGAAGGIMIVMICATVYHVTRGEVSSAVVTLVLLAMAAFVAYMRWRVAPIRPRPA